MRTVISRRIETNLEQFQFGFFDGEEFIPITPENVEKMAGTSLATPSALVSCLLDAFIYLQDCARDDLSDIWVRMDDLSSRIDELEGKK
jgi:hypothetical protein